MSFDTGERLERHFAKAHPPKRRLADPRDYWHDPGAGI